MKNLARLVLFFSISFVLVLLGVSGVRYLQLWIAAARMIPAQQGEVLPELAAAAMWALPAALYGSILLTLSYSAQKKIAAPLTICGVFVLSALVGGAVLLGIRRGEALMPALTAKARPTLGAPGLTLSQGGVVMVLLKDPADVSGSRVVSLPGRPLIYQELPAGPNNTILALPPVPFRSVESPFFTELAADLTLSGRQLSARMDGGLFSFGIYLGALCLLLASLRIIFELSSWPLANLLIGALAFRGVLALEILLNSREIQDFIGVFLGRFVPQSWISPLIFCGLGILIMLNTMLVFLARERRGKRG